MHAVWRDGYAPHGVVPEQALHHAELPTPGGTRSHQCVYPLCSVAESSGCSVVVVTDEANADVVMAGVAGCGVGGKQLRLEALAAANEWGLEDEERWVLTRTEQTRGTWCGLTLNPVQVGGHGEGGGPRRRCRPPLCGPTGGLL